MSPNNSPKPKRFYGFFMQWNVCPGNADRSASYGFIKPVDGSLNGNIYTNFDNAKSHDIGKGDIVEFCMGKNQMGPCAINVEKVAANVASSNMLFIMMQKVIALQHEVKTLKDCSNNDTSESFDLLEMKKELALSNRYHHEHERRVVWLTEQYNKLTHDNLMKQADVNSMIESKTMVYETALKKMLTLSEEMWKESVRSQKEEWDTFIKLEKDEIGRKMELMEAKMKALQSNGPFETQWPKPRVNVLQTLEKLQKPHVPDDSAAPENNGPRFKLAAIEEMIGKCEAKLESKAAECAAKFKDMVKDMVEEAERMVNNFASCKADEMDARCAVMEGILSGHCKVSEWPRLQKKPGDSE